MASNDKAKEASDWFGGFLGKAVKDIKSRPDKLKQAEDEAMGVSGDTQSASGKGRPEQSKKWIE